jgi:hypothetical protein
MGGKNAGFLAQLFFVKGKSWVFYDRSFFAEFAALY